jgi:hypothetical protein
MIRMASSFGGLEPIAVWGPLDPKLGHLALDHAGVGSQPPGWEHLEEDLASGFGMGVSERLRGKTRMGRRGPAGHPEGTDEAQPVWVGVGLEGDTVHQPADGVVHAMAGCLEMAGCPTLTITLLR